MDTQLGFLGTEATSETRPVILSLGLGVDSSALLVRWLREPSSRDFDLSQLTVLTAQVGEEHESTRRLTERYLYPMLREAGVRTVQVARAGKSVRDGLVVLDDSREPRRCHIEGAYRLSQEWLSAGTVPTFAGDRRLCTLKAKGAVLDAWVEGELRGGAYRSVVGFNNDERRRVERDLNFSTAQRQAEHPLVAWGWGREACESYLADLFGEPWLKSACTACPFAAGKCAAVQRLRKEEEGAVRALLVERMALALNPKMTLYRGKSLTGCIGEEEGEHILAELERRLDAMDWAVYRVRRWYEAARTAKEGKDPKVMTGRKTEILARGGRGDMVEAVRREARAQGRETVTDLGGERLYQHVRGDTLPAVEEFLVAAPGLADEKSRSGFEAAWRRLTGQDLWGDAMVRAA